MELMEENGPMQNNLVSLGSVSIHRILSACAMFINHTFRHFPHDVWFKTHRKCHHKTSGTHIDKPVHAIRAFHGPICTVVCTK